MQNCGITLRRVGKATGLEKVSGQHPHTLCSRVWPCGYRKMIGKYTVVVRQKAVWNFEGQPIYIYIGKFQESLYRTAGHGGELAIKSERKIWRNFLSW
jgi:hypothetical protein